LPKARHPSGFLDQILAIRLKLRTAVNETAEMNPPPRTIATARERGKRQRTSFLTMGLSIKERMVAMASGMRSSAPRTSAPITSAAIMSEA
jgi:hypothetical protein